MTDCFRNKKENNAVDITEEFCKILGITLIKPEEKKSTDSLVDYGREYNIYKVKTLINTMPLDTKFSIINEFGKEEIYEIWELPNENGKAYDLYCHEAEKYILDKMCFTDIFDLKIKLVKPKKEVEFKVGKSSEAFKLIREGMKFKLTDGRVLKCDGSFGDFIEKLLFDDVFQDDLTENKLIFITEEK